MKTNPFYKFIIVFTLLALIAGRVNAQQVISASGSDLKNNAGSLSFTLGELVTETKTAGNTTLTQGFHQPAITITAINDPAIQGISISVAPNPTSDYVNLKIEKGDIRNLEFILYDQHGKVLSNQKIIDSNTGIPFLGYISGTYFMRILQKGKEIQTFKIIKQ